MWKSGSTKPEAASPPPARFRIRGPYRVLLVFAVVFGIGVFLFPLLFGPGLEPPTDLLLGSPFSAPVQISNRNVTPLMDVEYDCVVSKLTLANGTAVGDAAVLVRSTIRKIAGRQAVTGRCETAFLINDPLKALEYKLTLKYRAYPWPQHRTSVHRMVAQINAKGRVIGWKVY